MGQFIGAGLAAIGSAAAGIGVGTSRRELPRGRAAQPGRRRRADGDALHRHRVRRGAGHLRVPRRAPADVRGLIEGGCCGLRVPEAAPKGAERDMAGETLGHEVLVEAEAGMPAARLQHLAESDLLAGGLASVGLYFILTGWRCRRIGTVLAERNDAISNDLEQAALFKRPPRRLSNGRLTPPPAGQGERGIPRRSPPRPRRRSTRSSPCYGQGRCGDRREIGQFEKRIGEIRESDLREGVEEVARATAAEIVRALMPSAATRAR